MTDEELARILTTLLPEDSPLRRLVVPTPNLHRQTIDAEDALAIESSTRELQIVHELLDLIDERERSLRRINIADTLTHRQAFQNGPQHHAPETLRMLRELRLRAYGKLVALRPAAGGPITFYRIAQANFGEPKIGVLNRLAPLAKELVSAEVGDEITTPRGLMSVVGVGYLERYAPEIAEEAENFRRMEVVHDGMTVVVENLARALQTRLDKLFGSGAAIEDVLPEEDREIRRGETERLGAHFYTRTTKLQEALMQRSEHGVAVILGVAGSGKTSVALGRTKVLCDRELEDGEERFFRSETAIGFVLSSGLCAYLERTCQQLMLYEMPVQEYHQLRSRLVELRRLVDTGFERDGTAVHQQFEGSMGWLASVDEAIARVFSTTLKEAVAAPPTDRETPKRVIALRTPEQDAALRPIWDAFAKQIAQIAEGLLTKPATRRFHVEELAARIDDARARFADRLEADPLWTGVQNRELRQNVRSATRERIVRALRLPDALSQALALNYVSTKDLVLEHGEGILPIAERAKGKKLSDRDIDVLLSVAHLISLKYRGRQDRDPISHLSEPDWFSQVFIDEFQDFTEVQLFLMGAQANPSHRTVTVVGDYLQRLSAGPKVDLARVFPWALPEETLPGLLLENKRQSGPLARLSQRFRELVLHDQPHSDLVYKEGELPHFQSAGPAELPAAVASAVLKVNRQHSVAVICESADEARALESALRDELGADFRQTRVSTRADLVARYYVHFTTALEAKGLEFDAVVVAGIERFNLKEEPAANACYVAISRPRRTLALIGDESKLDAAWMPLLAPELVSRSDIR